MTIKTEAGYEEALKKIDDFIADNFESSMAKQKEFKKIAMAIDSYERKYYPLPLADSSY